MYLVLYREEEGSESNAGNRYRRQLRRGYPPLTPNACAKDAVVSQLFDQAWGEVSWQKLFHLRVHSRIEHCFFSINLFVPLSESQGNGTTYMPCLIFLKGLCHAIFHFFHFLMLCLQKSLKNCYIMVIVPW